MTTAAPDTTPAKLIEQAGALRETIREQADEAEALGHYTPAVHEAFRQAGFYDLLTPRTYGGLEVDLRTFAKVMIEVACADPGTAWCLCLGQGHALSTATHWPQRAQDEVFANDAGYFRASHSFNPSGTAKRVDGGWLVNATSPYQSGVPYATHATVSVEVVDDTTGAPDATTTDRRVLQVLIPRDQFTVLDNWGGDKVLGMRASGSNTIVVDNQVVPEDYAVDMALGPVSGAAAPGLRIHGNPIYSGAASLSFFLLELVVTVVGAARGALDEYEHLTLTKSAMPPAGTGPRFKYPTFQQDFGIAQMKADGAEAIVLHVADTITRWSHDAVSGIREFTPQMDNRLVGMLLEAGELAGDAVDILFRSAGTSAALRGQRMQRYLRDVLMYRTHRATQYNASARRHGAIEFGELPNL
ncbi:acyl-CoA dehydrogenase family protein [Streptomyces sioyaensis]|uniref:Acyl-CoA dehydrogenase n=1 Tax=Streptomyces sioyaensis TaxID=67364 RepID=A0A4Q1QTT8_9ACTN|nr:acyl-CoA dehydrogenase family protein [Streptomyces sioyaensis]MBM4791284.1 acyl-CoA dehydrogenase family protein [Streptomyces sioyaensis]RXS65196.1 hypothetical protein EST54_19595 [Streptomyces sioyaensis]